MAVTRLSVAATPGRNYSFSAKASATGEHTGEFTHLSVAATPGPKSSFTAKTAADVGHSGEFTHLGPTGTPSRRYSFTAKTEASGDIEVIVTRANPVNGTPDIRTVVNIDGHLAAEEDDIIEIIQILLMTGIFE